MPMFINRRILKRYLISKNLLLEYIKYRNGNPVTDIFACFCVDQSGIQALPQDKFQTRYKVLSKLELSAHFKQQVHGYLVQFIRTAFL